MRVWKLKFSLVMKSSEPDDWDSVDSITVAANTIEEAIKLGLVSILKDWDTAEKARIDEAELVTEVDVA